MSVNQAGEASGVNNTFRQVGSSLGQALIGAVLISALVTQLNTDVSTSTVLPATLKPAVTAAVAANAESLGTASDQTAGHLPPPVVQEIGRIRTDSIVKATRNAMLATFIATLLALVGSLFLPKRSVRYAEDLDAAEAGAA